MGCDIHLKLEYRIKKEVIPSDIDQYTFEYLKELASKVKNGEITNDEYEAERDKMYNYLSFKMYINWNDTYFWRRDTWGDRCYGMFAKLAGVRNYWEDDINPMELRGFPEDASSNTYDNYCFTVIDDDKWCDYMEDGFYIKRSEADEYVEKYGEKILNKYNKDYLACCDYHSASWCTTQEMEDAINEIFKNKQDLSTCYSHWAALLGVMKGYESNGMFECRAVFWFDN